MLAVGTAGSSLAPAPLNVMLWLVLLWRPAAATCWEQVMTQGHISSSGPECTSYNEWRASLTGTEWSITLTTNGVTVACTDPTKAAAITTYIRDWTMPGHKGLDQVMSCDGITWAFGQCGPLDSVPSLMIRAGGGTGICDGSDCVAGSSEIMMRPCIDNANWGGGNGPTCGDRNNLIQPTQTFAISTGTSSQSSQCGGGSDSSGSSLVYVDWELSWTDAREYCRTHHDDLASIHSSAENAAVAALCPSGCWIGGSDSAQEGTWTWSDGTAWDYTNWYTNEPNNAYGGQDFLHIYGWDSAGRWDDAGEHSQPFVCSTRPRGTDEEDGDDEEDDDDGSDVVALVVSLCVVGAFLVVCGILYAKYPARAKLGFTLVKARCAVICPARAKQGSSPVKARRAALTARKRLAMWGGFDLSTATMGLVMSVWLMHEPTRGRRIEPFGTASIVFVTGTSVSIVTSAVVVCFQEGRKSNWGLRLTASFKTLGFLLVLGGLMECLHAPRSCAKAKCIRFCDPNRDGHCPDWASWVVGQTRATGPSKVGTHDRYDNDGLCWNKKVDAHDLLYYRGLKKYGTWFDPDFDNRDYGDNAWWGFETREDCEADVRRFVNFGSYRLACCLVCIPQLITGFGLIIALCRTEGAKVAAVNAATTGDDTITVEAPPGNWASNLKGRPQLSKRSFPTRPWWERSTPAMF